MVMYNKAVLDNGLRVITSTMPHSRSVCLAILVGAGSCYESEEEAGISHFAEHLFFKGTQRRPTSKEITQDIEGVGGIINAGTDKELTIFWCKVAKPHFPVALDVLSDLLLNSLFDSKEIEQERRIISEEINMNLDLPQQRISMLIDELLWPEQPLGREVIGYRETVSSITREQLLNYVAHRYMPNNTVLSIAGNIQHEEAVAQIEPLFSKWAAGELITGYITDDKQTEARLRIEPRDIEQAHLCLAVHGFSRSHPQRFTLDLLNTVLGGGMSSRLFTEIREHRGLAYDIHSYTEHFLKSGAFAIYAGVDPQKIETAVVAILEEMSQIKQRITANELTRAKELSKGRLYLRFEDSQNVALWYGGQEILTQQILDIDDVISIVDAITIDELKEVAEEILTDSGLNLAVTGPIKEEESYRDSLIKEKPLRQLLKL
ncbi:MAG: insulinase family protein [Dehalococcoidia bacterium]|nr:MAG: insulinase family protein [Dehalococcoidia bacterium]